MMWFATCALLVCRPRVLYTHGDITRVARLHARARSATWGSPSASLPNYSPVGMARTSDGLILHVAVRTLLQSFLTDHSSPGVGPILLNLVYYGVLDNHQAGVLPLMPCHCRYIWIWNIVVELLSLMIFYRRGKWRCYMHGPPSSGAFHYITARPWAIERHPWALLQPGPPSPSSFLVQALPLVGATCLEKFLPSSEWTFSLLFMDTWHIILARHFQTSLTNCIYLLNLTGLLLVLLCHDMDCV